MNSKIVATLDPEPHNLKKMSLPKVSNVWSLVSYLSLNGEPPSFTTFVSATFKFLISSISLELTERADRTRRLEVSHSKDRAELLVVQGDKKKAVYQTVVSKFLEESEIIDLTDKVKPNCSEDSDSDENSVMDLNAPLESFRGNEEALYSKLFKEEISKTTVIRVERLLIALNSSEADFWLKKLFFLNDSQESHLRSFGLLETFNTSLFGIFRHLANHYLETSEEKFLDLVQNILNSGTSEAQEVCLLWLQSYNRPSLVKPLLEFIQRRFTSDPKKSELATWLITEYVKEIRKTDDSIECELVV